MSSSIKYAGIVVSICTLCACSSFNPNGYTNYQTYTEYGTDLYPEGYENTANYTDYPAPKQSVSVPESYHVSAYHSPIKPKDVDQQWVGSQNANGYTIEVAEGEQPASVAKTLLKVPKNERKAEVNAGTRQPPGRGERPYLVAGRDRHPIHAADATPTQEQS